MGVIPVRTLSVILWQINDRGPVLSCCETRDDVVAESPGIRVGAVQVEIG